MGRVYSPTGAPTLDKLCGGGVPHEAIIYIYGGPGLGKTTLALNMLRAMGSGVWVDCSHTLTHSYAWKEMDEDTSSVTIIQPNEEPDISLFLPFIGTTPMLVLDDLTALSDKLARPLQAFIKTAKQLLPGSGTTLLFTNQVRHSKNGYLPPGGLSYTKSSDLVLELGPKYKRSGDNLSVEVSIVRSTVGPCQGVRTIPFRWGLDKVQDTIAMAIKMGVINQAGSWYSYGDIRVQGLANLEFALSKDIIDHIYAEVMRHATCGT